MKIQFSPHAFDRVEKRLTMDAEAIATLFHWDLSVLIGAHADEGRTHHLFYSGVDDDYFIAVLHDSGWVVTVLPIAYARWPVGADVLARARALATGSDPVRAPAAEVSASRSDSKRTVRILMYVVHCRTNGHKQLEVCELQVDHARELRDIVVDSSVHDVVRQHLPTTMAQIHGKPWRAGGLFAVMGGKRNRQSLSFQLQPATCAA
ncbi:MAG: hypothetical protein Q7S96_00320 [bacterium]|nr:hypothetical protein [bacterium]